MKNIFNQFITLSVIMLLCVNTNAQVISTFAGNGVAGSGGDGGSATAAQLSNPTGVAFDAAGNVYISDYSNSRIRKVTPAGIISTYAGTGAAGFSGDGGNASAAQLNLPSMLALDAAGNFFIADAFNNRIRKVTPAGIISTYVGTGAGGFGGDGGAATAAQISFPTGIAFDANGNMYIADRNNNRVRMVTPSGIISTFAGTGIGGFSGDGGTATSAQLSNPNGVSFDGSGNLYIADKNNHRIRKVTPAGIISTYAGTGVGGFSGDGAAATAAQINLPFGINFDAANNAFIADFNNRRIRKINQAGIISTFAGTGVAGFSGDGGLASSAQISNSFEKVAIDAIGNIYIPDAGNQRVRKITCTQPTVNASASGSSICIGESATLTASGADFYAWTPSNSGTSIVISPTVSSSYTVTGTYSLTGCRNSTVITMNVSPCTGILNLTTIENSELKIYPNPNNGEFTIQAVENLKLNIINELGQIMQTISLDEKNNRSYNIAKLSAGIYFISSSNGTVREKIIVTK